MKVTVAGGGPLAAHVKGHCRQPKLTGRKGKIVLLRRGSGFFTTRPFTITSKRWTLDFHNGGAFFQVFIMRGKRVQPELVSLAKRGSGSQAFKGPGTFKLKIAGSRSWTVRVRDGA